MCHNIVERESLCGCRLCNNCIREWISNKLVCPYCFVKVYGNKVEIKGDIMLQEMINNLVSQFEGVGFKTYHLELEEKKDKTKDTIVTIHEIVKKNTNHL